MQDKLRWILDVTRKLAAPLDLDSLLRQVVEAAKEVLDAESGTVWLYDADADELVMQTSLGLDPVRIPADHGIVGACVRTRAAINVPDCYEDPRFNPEMDRKTGFRTRSMLTLPLVGHDESMVGAIQILNRRRGAFDHDDEDMASALAAQCAVALQRAQMTDRLLQGEQLRQEISVAREIQLGTLPRKPPHLPGYDIVGTFRPADATGGDTYDFVPGPEGSLLVLVADATGHGIGPALSAAQVRAMLRVSQRLGAGIDETFRHINNQLALDLPEDRFVTAFLGRLDPHVHELRYHSGGQGPMLHFQAASGTCESLAPTTVPLGTMAQIGAKAARILELEPGDLFVLCSDGVFDHRNAAGEEFGAARVASLLSEYGDKPMSELLGRVLGAMEEFGGGIAQEDDVTVVLIRRLPDTAETVAAARARPVVTAGAPVRETFPRDLAALSRIFDFVAAFIEREQLGASERYALGFTLEELFTNILKYSSKGTGEIEVILERRGGEVLGSIVNPDSEDFDVSSTPDVDISLPADKRRTGGLGLHLIRRVMDGVEYEYTGHASRIAFRKKVEVR